MRIPALLMTLFLAHSFILFYSCLVALVAYTFIFFDSFLAAYTFCLTVLLRSIPSFCFALFLRRTPHIRCVSDEYTLSQSLMLGLLHLLADFRQ